METEQRATLSWMRQLQLMKNPFASAVCHNIYYGSVGHCLHFMEKEIHLASKVSASDVGGTSSTLYTVE